MVLIYEAPALYKAIKDAERDCDEAAAKAARAKLDALLSTTEKSDNIDDF